MDCVGSYVSEKLVASVCGVVYDEWSTTNLEVATSSEVLIHVYQHTLCHFRGDRNLDRLNTGPCYSLTHSLLAAEPSLRN